MDVGYQRQGKSSQHSGEKLDFRRCSNSFGIPQTQNQGWCYEKPNSGRDRCTLLRIKMTPALQRKVSVWLGEKSNQVTDSNPNKISRCSRDSEVSKKRKAQEAHKHHDNEKSKSVGKENVRGFSKSTSKLLPSRKGSEQKKCLKRKFEDKMLNNNLEQDALSKSRSKARKLDNVMMVSAFLNPYSLYLNFMTIILVG